MTDAFTLLDEALSGRLDVATMTRSATVDRGGGARHSVRRRTAQNAPTVPTSA